MRRGIFDHAVARLHDQLDPGGGHVEQVMADERKPAWERDLADFQDGAASGPEFDVEDDGE